MKETKRSLIKKVLAAIIPLTCVFYASCTNSFLVSAADYSQDGLDTSFTVTAGTDSSKLNGVLKISNTNTFDVENIALDYEKTTGYQIVPENLKSKIDVLKTGEEITLNFEYKKEEVKTTQSTGSNSSSSGTSNKTNTTSSKSTVSSSPRTGDSFPKVLASTILAVSGLTALLCIKKKKGRKFLSLVLAGSMCGATVFELKEIPVSAAVDVHSFTVSEDYTNGSDKLNFKIKVSYDYTVNTPETEDPENPGTQGGQEDPEVSGLNNGSPWVNSNLHGNVTKDMKTDPKDDFFLYVNKDWIVDSKIPDGQTGYSWYDYTYNNNKDLMIELLNKNEPKDHDDELVQNIYNAYLDMDSRNKAGVEPVAEAFNYIQNIASFEELNNIIAEGEHDDILFTFFGAGADVGFEDPDHYIGVIGNPGLLLGDSAEYTQMTERGALTYNYDKEDFLYITERLGMENTKAEEIFDNAIDYEREYAKYIYTYEDQMASDYFDKINNKVTIEDIYGISEYFPVEAFMKNYDLVYDGVYLNISPEYYSHFDEFYNADHFEKIKDTMLVRYMCGNLSLLDEEAVQKSKELAAKYKGVEGERSAEETAFGIAEGMFAHPATKMFVKNFSSEEDRKVVEDTCYNVISTYKEMLSENDWLSDETKAKAIEKLDAIDVHVGWPDVWDDYSDLDISGLSLIDAVKKVGAFRTERMTGILGQEVDKDNWASMSLIRTNAYYSMNNNSINMNVGMMGEPFYYSGMPKEELYASLAAFWIGHEISHAFDSNGAQFNKDGAYESWWTEEDYMKFIERVEKVDNYLSSIRIMGDYMVNGSNVDSEMIADFTGLQCALKMAEKEENFDYKKFFEYYAKMNSSISLYYGQLGQIMGDSHPLDYLRVNVPVQQFDEFYEAYDIKPGDNMYLAPEDRILIW